ncbi:MAG: SMI1/KNR4 family protein [Acidobacteriota bacterium]
MPTAERYRAMRELIEAHPDFVDFAEFGQGISEERIQEAEALLGLRFPASYRWWLRQYGGGEVGGEEIYSLYPPVPGAIAAGDITFVHALDRAAGREPHHLAISHDDIDGVFTFDLSHPESDGEYPIFSMATGRQYARDFLEFLEKRIRVRLD